MSRSLYLTYVRLARTGFVAWAIAIALYAVLIVYLYPSMRDAFPFLEYIEAIPEQMKAAIGISEKEAIEMAFPGGVWDFRAWMNTEYLSWWPLLVGVYAVVYCGGLVSREVERGTLDLLLSQPLRRATFLLSKFSAFATLVIGIGLVSFAVLAVGSLGIDAELGYWYLALAHVVAVLFVLAIAAYSTLASCLLLDPGKSMAVSGVVTAFIYFLYILAPSLKAATWLQKGSLFYYYEPLYTLYRGTVNWAGIGVYLGVMLASLLLSVVVFQRKDILR